MQKSAQIAGKPDGLEIPGWSACLSTPMIALLILKYAKKEGRTKKGKF